MVQLSLEFNGVERNFSVSPLHATLIMHFEGKNEVMCCGDLATYVVIRCSDGWELWHDFLSNVEYLSFVSGFEPVARGLL